MVTGEKEKEREEKEHGEGGDEKGKKEEEEEEKGEEVGEEEKEEEEEDREEEEDTPGPLLDFARYLHSTKQVSAKCAVCKLKHAREQQCFKLVDTETLDKEKKEARTKRNREDAATRKRDQDKLDEQKRCPEVSSWSSWSS